MRLNGSEWACRIRFKVSHANAVADFCRSFKVKPVYFNSMKKTQIIFNSGDINHQEWYEGEKGYIDGYVQAGDSRPYACVVVGNRVVMAPLNCLTIECPDF